MYVSSYFYEVSDKELEDRFELIENRNQYMNQYYISRFKDKLESISCEGNVGLFYVGGAGVHNSEGRVYEGKFECSLEIEKSGMAIRNLQAYMLHRYAGILSKKNSITYANINSNTCASSIHSVWEAEMLMKAGIIDSAVIVAEEKTNFDTVRIFSEHMIEVKPGEGFACIVLSKEGTGARIEDTKWAFSFNSNPFYVSEEGYSKVKSETKLVKGHKTGTEQNDKAEELVFGETFGYKDRIGHCQGASGLIEVCMVLDEGLDDVLCVASGLGGFYGSCVVRR